MRVVTERSKSVACSALGPSGRGVDVFSVLPIRGDSGGVAGGNGSWVNPRRVVRERKNKLGSGTEYTLTLLEREIVTTHQWIEQVTFTG